MKAVTSIPKISQISTQSVGILNCQMSQSSNTNNCTCPSDLLISLDWSVGCDTGTEKWWHLSDVHTLRNVENPILIDLHVSGIPSKVCSVQEFSFVAQVCISLWAVIALVAWVSYWAHSDEITNFYQTNIRPNACNLTNDFVARAAWVVAWSPMLSDSSEVWVADWSV